MSPRSSCGMNNNGNIEQSLAELIRSIALTGTATAQLLKAEADKIEKAIEVACNVDDLIKINNSVNKTLAQAINLENSNYQKLDEINDLFEIIDKDCACHDDHACNNCANAAPEAAQNTDCCCRTPRTCKSIFFAATENFWTNGSMTFRKGCSCANSCAMLCHKNCDSYIILPPGKKLSIEYDIEIINKSLKPADIDMKLCDGNGACKAIHLFTGDSNHILKAKDRIIFDNSMSDKKGSCSIWLLSSLTVRVLQGVLRISEL